MPKAYFGYEPAEARCRYEPMVVVDRYKAYAFLKELLQLAYCWAHMRRDFLQLRLGGQEDQAWADSWIERIAKLYELNKQRLTLAKSQNCPESLPAPFVELDLERMSSSGYAQADEALHHALAEMAQQSAQELAQNHPSRLRRKVLASLQTHWPGLTLFADHPQIPMDNNGAERDFSHGELERIRALIAQGQACRSQLARQVCQEFGWLNAQGPTQGDELQDRTAAHGASWLASATAATCP